MKTTGLTVIKNAQTCADIPASQNVPTNINSWNANKPGQFQIPCRHSPFIHDTRYVTSLHN